MAPSALSLAAKSAYINMTTPHNVSNGDNGGSKGSSSSSSKYNSNSNAISAFSTKRTVVSTTTTTSPAPSHFPPSDVLADLDALLNFLFTPSSSPSASISATMSSMGSLSNTTSSITSASPAVLTTAEATVAYSPTTPLVNATAIVSSFSSSSSVVSLSSSAPTTTITTTTYPTSESSTSSTSAPTSTSSESSSIPLGTTKSVTSHPRLSSSQLAGVISGSVVAFALIILLSLLYIWQRRRKNRSQRQVRDFNGDAFRASGGARRVENTWVYNPPKVPLTRTSSDLPLVTQNQASPQTAQMGGNVWTWTGEARATASATTSAADLRAEYPDQGNPFSDEDGRSVDELDRQQQEHDVIVSLLTPSSARAKNIWENRTEKKLVPRPRSNTYELEDTQVRNKSGPAS